MKKILYLISSLKKSGPNRVLLSMINGIDKTKYEAYIVSFLNNNDLDYVTSLKKKVNNIYLLNFDKKIHIVTKGPKKLKRIANEIHPDIIHSHGTLPDIANSKLEYNVKKITTIHDNMFEDYLYSFGKIKGKFYIKWHLHYLKRFNKCVCCSFSSYNILKDYLNNTTYIRNSIFEKELDKSFYKKARNSIRNKYKIKKEDIVYIYAGNLIELKNVIEMVKCFNENLKENEYLLVLGKGNLENELKDAITNNHIIFVGFTDKVKEYMCASDVYVSFSSSEGFSISVLEALETNNYLLLSNIPSHNEIINLDPSIYIGEVFNINNFKNMKKTLNSKIENNENSNTIILNKYLNIKIMMDNYYNIYNK